MQRYGLLAKVVRPGRIGRVVPNDPDDDAVIACALAARADLIVSGDKHPLGLVGSIRASPSLPQPRPSNSSADKGRAASATLLSSGATRSGK